MTDPLFDRYREALRAGHVAGLRGRLEDAATSYQEAARLAPDRAVPRAALGAICLELSFLINHLCGMRRPLHRGPFHMKQNKNIVTARNLAPNSRPPRLFTFTINTACNPKRLPPQILVAETCVAIFPAFGGGGALWYGFQRVIASVAKQSSLRLGAFWMDSLRSQ